MEVNNKNNEYVRKVAEQKYEFGFTTNVHTDIIDVGLNEDIIRLISAKKEEPEWMLEFRLKAFRYWQTLEEPTWGHVNVPKIDYQAISYYADPMAKKKEGKKMKTNNENGDKIAELEGKLEHYKQIEGTLNNTLIMAQSTAEDIKNNVINNLRKDRANMILMHDIKTYTRDALRDIIKYAKENGYRFEVVTMDTDMVQQRVNN